MNKLEQIPLDTRLVHNMLTRIFTLPTPHDNFSRPPAISEY